MPYRVKEIAVVLDSCDKHEYTMWGEKMQKSRMSKLVVKSVTTDL
jgi:hypothetical protein